MSNDSIYKSLMDSRKKNPKHYGLTCIAVEYEDVLNYSRSKKKSSEELRWRISKLKSRIKEVMAMYKLSSIDIADYFRFHNYNIDFLT